MKLITYLALTLAGSLLVAMFSLDTATLSAKLGQRLSTPLNPTPALAATSDLTMVKQTQRSVAGHIFHLQTTTPAQCEEAHMLLDQEQRMLPPTTVYNQDKNNKLSGWVDALCTLDSK